MQKIIFNVNLNYEALMTEFDYISAKRYAKYISDDYVAFEKSETSKYYNNKSNGTVMNYDEILQIDDFFSPE